MKFRESDEYKKDLKKLAKRFKTLPGDIEVLKKVIEVEPDERPPIYESSWIGSGRDNN